MTQSTQNHLPVIIGMNVLSGQLSGMSALNHYFFRGEFPEASASAVSADWEGRLELCIQRMLQTVRLEPAALIAGCLSVGLWKPISERGYFSQTIDFSATEHPFMAALQWIMGNNDTPNHPAILLVETLPNQAGFSAVLFSSRIFATERSLPPLAILEAAAENKQPLSATGVANACRAALKTAGVTAKQVKLIITGGSDTEITGSFEETLGLIDAYQSQAKNHCALAADGVSPLLALIKAIWCLDQAVIPITPQWEGTDQPEIWENTPFYVSAASHTWFSSEDEGQRRAALNLFTENGNFLHLILAENRKKNILIHQPLAEERLKMFPVSASSAVILLEQLSQLKDKISSGDYWQDAAANAYDDFLENVQDVDKVVCLLAKNPAELVREAAYAAKGIPSAFETNSDWQTPAGSFFSPVPLGADGKIAFVYPGAFNSYPELGRDLFYLFPSLHEHFDQVTEDIGEMLNETKLYPRSMNPFSPADYERIEASLTADPITMLISGSSFSFIYTKLLCEILGVQPASAFGYSLGEISMLFASDVWNNGQEVSAALRRSALFRDRLAGPQQAIRDYWQTTPQKVEDAPLWKNYILITTPEKAQEEIKKEPKVYLTQINTPRQVVIGGDPQSCQRVIARLKCSVLQAPFDYALHCEAMQSEYDALKQLHTWEVANKPGMKLYSAASYRPILLDKEAIAADIGSCLCTPLDFPRLIQTAYTEGARIFIELGAGSNCTRWIDETLKSQPHAAFTINRKGVDDFSSILKLAARLVCHKVPVKMNLFFESDTNV